MRFYGGMSRSVLRWLVVASVWVSFATMPTPSSAWGSAGHQIVATLAERQLTPQAKFEVQRLLAIEPGSTLASVSNWTDERRSPATAAWHYVNMPRDSSCQYDVTRDCPDGQCVAGAIKRQRRVLASSAPDLDRLKALKYLVHFVADVDQPLHAGFADDKGGNRYHLQAFGRGTNLHALRDSGLINNRPQAVHRHCSPSSKTRTRTRTEPPRRNWRLQLLRRWSHEDESEEVFTRGSGASREDGERAPRRTPIAMGGD